MGNIPHKVLADLVAKSQKGDEKAFGEIFDYFYPKLLGYVALRVGEKEMHEDLVSDIFLKLVSKLELYAVQEGISFSAWVFCIARNTIIDYYRQQKKFLSLDEVDENGQSLYEKYFLETEETPEKILAEKRDTQEVRVILASLPNAYREVMELKYIQDFSNEEISKITGKTEGNIRIIQMRALQKLRQKLEKPE